MYKLNLLGKFVLIFVILITIFALSISFFVLFHELEKPEELQIIDSSVEEVEPETIIPFRIRKGWNFRIYMPLEFKFYDEDTGEYLGTMKLLSTKNGFQIFWNDKPQKFFPKIKE